MKQLLSGIEHCHNKGVLHRDIKSSNLLVSEDGILKIADFGLATHFDPDNPRPMTSQVITLWYRPPELMLGATHYSVGVDLWSVGCVLAELLLGEPIFPGRTEVGPYEIRVSHNYLQKIAHLETNLRSSGGATSQGFQAMWYSSRRLLGETEVTTSYIQAI